jgi:FkbM family methyltransferase
MQSPDPRKASVHQQYFGYPLEHVAMLEKYRAEPVPPTPGCYTDYFGIRTRLSLFGFEQTEWFEQNSGMLPFPDDSLHAETIEYLACARAVDQSSRRLAVVELGAGWGPWITLCAVMGLRKGVTEVELVAVEADRRKLELMRTHLSENGLPFDAAVRHPSGANVRMKCIHAGVAAKTGTISFSVGEGVDWGGAVSEKAGREDYRGLKLPAATIPAISIADATKELEAIDIMHVDIQGAERSAIPAAIDSLNRKVKFLALGTHSRPIEGEMVELFVANGWKLEYEKPCKMDFQPGISIEGMTKVDGLQFWMNPRRA